MDRFIATLLSYGATARHESHGLMRVDLPVHATTGGHYGRMILEVREHLAAPD